MSAWKQNKDGSYEKTTTSGGIARFQFMPFVDLPHAWWLKLGDRLIAEVSATAGRGPPLAARDALESEFFPEGELKRREGPNGPQVLTQSGWLDEQ